MASWNDSNKKRDKNNSFNKNTYNKNYSTDFFEITSDYKNPQPLHQEEQKPKPLLQKSKTLKVDAPSFIPKNSSLNKSNSINSQKPELEVIIQQDKFFFNNKFNLNSNNQNMMLQTLNSIPSQDVATLPQNPVINPYLNGHNPYPIQFSPMNNNLINPPQQNTQNSVSSPIKAKLDVNAKAFVKKKSSSEEMNQKSSTMLKKEESKSPIIPDLGIVHENIQKSEEVSKFDYYNSSIHVSYDDPIKFNILDSKKNDDLFRGNLNEFNSKFDMDTSNNFEEKNTSKENEIVEKILEENTFENESNYTSSKDHENINFHTKDIDDKEQFLQEKDKEINKHTENNINQDSNQILQSVGEKETINNLNNVNILQDIVDDKIQNKTECVEEKSVEVLDTNEKPTHRETENFITETLPQQKGFDNSKQTNDLLTAKINQPENHTHENQNSPTQGENIYKQQEESPLFEIQNKDNKPIKLSNHNSNPFETSDNNIRIIDNCFINEEVANHKNGSNSDNIVQEEAKKDVDELGQNIPERLNYQSSQSEYQLFSNNPLGSNPFQISRDYDDNVLTTENNDDLSQRRENNNIFIEDQSFSNHQSLRDSTPFSSKFKEEFSNDFSKTLPNTKSLKINTEQDYINSELHAYLNSNRNSTISRTSRANGKGNEKDYMKKPITGYRKLTSHNSTNLNTCRASINSIPKITYLFDLNQPIIGEERLSSRVELVKMSASCDQKPTEEILIKSNEKESEQTKLEINTDNETSVNLQNIDVTDKLDVVIEKNEEDIKILEPSIVQELTPIQEENEEEKVNNEVLNDNKENDEQINNQEENKNFEIIEEVNNNISNLSEKNDKIEIKEEICTETINSNVETVPLDQNEPIKEPLSIEDIQKPIQNEVEDSTKTDIQEPVKKEEADKNNNLTIETPVIVEPELKKEDSDNKKGVSFNLNRQTTMDSKNKYKAKIFKGKSRTLVTVNTELKTSSGKENNVTSKHQTSEANYEITKKYFKVSKGGEAPSQTIKFNEQYINHFRNWKICRETHLIENILQDHLEQMKVFTDEKMNLNNQNKNNKNRKEYNQKSLTDNDLNRNQFSKSSQNSTPNESPSIKADDTANFSRLQSQNSLDVNSNFNNSTIGNWARRNFAEAEKEAQEYKGKLDIERKVDPIKDELKEILNKSTLDNYDTIKALIFEKICDSIENQEKFMEVLFNKAIVEKSFVVIYARLCKDMDNELPQKVELNEQEKKLKNINGSSTIFRSKLIEKCRKIFKEEKNTIFDNCSLDPEEREQKEKDFILGRELIKSRILSKNVVFQCLEHLQKNLEKLINIEGICMLLDKFGTQINKNENTNKVKSQKLNELNDKLDYYFNTLIKLETSNSNLPGYIRYKIINLIEKKKRGWQESKVDQVLKIKSLKEVHKEYEQEINETSPTNNNNLNNSVQNQTDNKEYLNKEITNDLIEWKKLKEAKKNEKNFGWKCIENLHKKEKYTISMIFESFGNIIIDFIKDTNDCDYCYTYIDSIFSYYQINKNVKSEIVNIVLDYLTNLNDYLLDNKMLIEVWVNILYSLINNEIFLISDFEKLTNLTKEQYSTVYEVSCKTVKLFTQKQQKQFFTEMNKLSFFKVYPEIFSNMRNY